MSTLADTAQSARFEKGSIVISMQSGTQLSFPVSDNPRLASGLPSQLNNIELSPSGLHWPDLDEDLSFAGIILGDHGQRQENSHGLERLSELVLALSELYHRLSGASGKAKDHLPPSTRGVGRDKSSDFLGVAMVMEHFRELLIALWDRVVYFKEKRQTAQLDILIKSLPVLAKISEMESSGYLKPELAEIVRRRVENGIKEFLQTGTTISGASKHTYHEPRTLVPPTASIFDTPPPVKSSNHKEP